MAPEGSTADSPCTHLQCAGQRGESPVGESPMSITFACPKCSQSYTVNDRDAGKKAECKMCGQRLQVPAPARLHTTLGSLPDEPASAAEPALEPYRELEPAPEPEPYHIPRRRPRYEGGGDDGPEDGDARPRG